jgi:hypothetical protein
VATTVIPTFSEDVYTQVSVTWNRLYPVKQMVVGNLDPVFNQIVGAKPAEESGRGFGVNLQYGVCKTRPIGRGGTMDTSERQIQTRANIESRNTYTNITLVGDDLLDNTGTEAIMKLTQLMMDNAFEAHYIADDTTLGDKGLIKQFYSDGNDFAGDEMTGIFAALDQGTFVGTYMNISRSTAQNTWMNAQCTTYAAGGSLRANLTYQGIMAAWNSATFSGRAPMIAVTDPTTWQYIGANLIQAGIGGTFFSATGQTPYRVTGGLEVSGEIGQTGAWFPLLGMKCYWSSFIPMGADTGGAPTAGFLNGQYLCLLRPDSIHPYCKPGAWRVLDPALEGKLQRPTNVSAKMGQLYSRGNFPFLRVRENAIIRWRA